MNLDSPFWGNRVRSEYAPKRVRSVCAPNGRMADWLGNHQAGKGVHTVDTLDGVDERGSVKVDTLNNDEKGRCIIPTPA